MSTDMEEKCDQNQSCEDAVIVDYVDGGAADGAPGPC
jgi:hypothetical protein